MRLEVKGSKSERCEEFKEYIPLSDLQFESYTYTEVQIRGCNFKLLILRTKLRREMLHFR